MLNLVGVFAQVLVTILGLGIPTAIFRFYIAEEDEAGRRAVLSACLALLGITALPMFVIALFSKPISGWLLDDPALFWLLVLSLLSLLGDLLQKVPFARIRAQEQSGRFVTISTALWLATIVFSVLFVVGFEWGVYGVIGAQALVHLPGAIVLLVPLFRDHLPRPDPARMKALLVYGVPLIPSVLSGFIIKLSDRLILKIFEPMETVGLYSIGSRIAEVVVLAGTSFQFAWVPFAFHSAKEVGGKQRLAYVGETWFAMVILASLALALFAREALWILTPPSYHSAVAVVPVLLLGLSASALYMVGSMGVQIGDRTRYLFTVNGVAAGLNVALNFLLVPRWGMMGAAWGTAISYLVRFGLVFYFSQKAYPLPFRHLRWLLGAGAAIVLATVALELQEHLSNVQAILVKAVALALAVAVFAALDLARPSQVKRLLRLRKDARARKKKGGPQDTVTDTDSIDPSV